MPDVFINYRTGDEEATATLFERELARRFGPDKVFKASNGIPPGSDFEAGILNAVRSSSVLLAVVGSRWLYVQDESGRRLLDKRSDWTRREIVEAFNHDVKVVPVLVGAAPRLVRAHLPAALQRLSSCQYLRFDHRDADAGIDRLGNDLARLVPRLSSD
jgi:hypothetical protein